VKHTAPAAPPHDESRVHTHTSNSPTTICLPSPPVEKTRPSAHSCFHVCPRTQSCTLGAGSKRSGTHSAVPATDKGRAPPAQGEGVGAGVALLDVLAAAVVVLDNDEGKVVLLLVQVSPPEGCIRSQLAGGSGHGASGGHWPYGHMQRPEPVGADVLGE